MTFCLAGGGGEQVATEFNLCPLGLVSFRFGAQVCTDGLRR